MKHRDTSDLVAWARRINHGWFVRNHLDQSAEAWLNHLAINDPPRLLACCEIARALSRGPDRTHDPKPWFYAGLFALATPDEATRFLAHHKFTSAAIPALASDPEVNAWVLTLSPTTQNLLARVRTAVRSHASPDHPPQLPASQ